MRRDAWMGMLLWWSRQPPAAHSCSLWNHLNSFHGGMFEPNAKYDADSLIYSLSRFECRSHRVNMFIQQHLPPLLTSTVILSLFTHACLSPLSLAARLHQCEANHSRYINNGWIFSGHTSYSEPLQLMIMMLIGLCLCIYSNIFIHSHFSRMLTMCRHYVEMFT